MGERLELRPVADDENAEFAHDLTRGNMSRYVARHWGEWSREIFFANFTASENLIGWRGNERISLIRRR